MAPGQPSVIQGHLTAAGLARYLRSPIFLLLRHPELTTDPIRWERALVSHSASSPAALAWWARGRLTLCLGWGPGDRDRHGCVRHDGPGDGGPSQQPVPGRHRGGRLHRSLGFAFALLESRSTLPTRRLLAPFSVLPIITPAFVLGLAMNSICSAVAGFITHTLLGAVHQTPSSAR